MRRASNAAMVGSVLAFVALVAVSLSAQGNGGSAEGRKMKNPVASSAASITAGKAAYQKYCRFCHGAEALGLVAKLHFRTTRQVTGAAS